MRLMHDLEVVNAAIRLGDRPYPPIGALITEILGESLFRVYDHDIVKRKIEMILLVADEEEYGWFLPQAAFYQVVSLPDDALPFNEWLR